MRLPNERTQPASSRPESRGVLIDWLVPVYDLVCRAAGVGPALRRHTLALAELRRGERVLDVGCGTGVLTRLAAEIVGVEGKVVGIDPGPAMIERARRNAARAGNSAAFELAGTEALPFADGTFDLVLSSLMLHHLPLELKRKGLGEARRVLRPGGRILLFDFDPAQPIGRMTIRMMRMVPAYNHVLCDIGEPAEHLRAAGFTEIRKIESWRRRASFWLARTPAAGTGA